MDKLLIELLPKEKIVEAFNFSESLTVSGITDDSRKVKRGFLFIARKGKSLSGENFIPEAIKRGASAILRESPIDPTLSIPQIRVKNLHNVMGEVVLNFYERPEKVLTLIGITGTNGKSSTSFFLTSLLRNLSFKAGYLGTLYYDIEEIYPAKETTPSIVDLAPFLKKAVERGLKFIVMEVSSHALDQDRIFPLKFKLTAFTNLSRDHLDYHGSMEDYYKAKKKLFTHYLEKGGKAVVSLEGDYGKILAKELLEERVLGEKDLIRVNNEELKVEILNRYPGLELLIRAKEGDFRVRTQVFGDYQAKNIGTLCGCALALGLKWEEIVPALESLKNPPGRLELCGVKGTSLIFVDYAHTPDALESALKSLYRMSKGRLIVLFGCGGNRDQGKRPLMGKVACKYADVIILTSDNPRYEDPNKIIEDIKMGLNGNKPYFCISDRREALAFAIKMLKNEDLLLVAGKGHEDYQEIAGKRYPFSDKEEIKRILGELESYAC